MNLDGIAEAVYFDTISCYFYAPLYPPAIYPICSKSLNSLLFKKMQANAVSQAVDAMTQILKIAQAQSVEVAQKLIKMNVENAVGILQDDQMGKIIDLYV